MSIQDENPWKSCLFPCFSEQRELLYSSCSEKAPFVVHKITIDYAFDQVIRAKMQSLHENFAPQILVFRHELPFFPSYFVWNPFCFCRGFVFVFAVNLFLFLPWIPFVFVAVDLFLPWMPLCIFLLTFCFSLFSLVPSIFSHEIRKTWEFFWKKSIVFWKKSIVFLRISIVFGGYSLTSILPEPPCGEQKGSATL